MTWQRRLILANLDCENELAGLPSRLSARVQARVAALSTLLRVFARPTDRLWTLVPVAPERLPDTLGLTCPELISGPIELVASVGELLAWGETASAARLRARLADPSDKRLRPPADFPWGAPRAAPDIVARVCDRTYQLALAQRLGLALDHAAVVDDIVELPRLIRAAHCERWVLKAPYSAAGRERVFGRGEHLSLATERQADRLLKRFGRLVFEPWLQRVLDISCCAQVTADGVDLLGVQQQDVHENGSFRGIIVWRDFGRIAASEREAVEKATGDIGEALYAEGFRGPFGIDAWCYRTPHTERALHPLGEVNPRLTFGFVARALARRVWRTADADVSAVRLCLGRAPDLPPASPRCWPLLLAGPDDDTVAWAEALPSSS